MLSIVFFFMGRLSCRYNLIDNNGCCFVCSVLMFIFFKFLVEVMKMFFRIVLFGSLMVVCVNSYVFSEFEVEDMVDLMVVFVFLKNDCGY